MRAGRLLRTRRQLHQAGGRLRRRPLEEQAHARGRPCRCDGRRQRRCAGQGTLVHGEVRRRRHLTRPSSRSSPPGAVVTNIAHIAAALTAVMRANADAAGFRIRRQAGAQAVVRLQPRAGPAAGAEIAGRRGARAVQRTGRAAQHANRRRRAAPVDEGCVRRLADGRKTQMSSLHGMSMLEAATLPFEANVALALMHDTGGVNDRRRSHRRWRPTSTCSAGPSSRRRRPPRGRQRAQRGAGGGGSHRRAARGRPPRAMRSVHDRTVRAAGLGMEFGASLSETFDVAKVDRRTAGADRRASRCARAVADRGVEARGGRSVFLRWLRACRGIRPTPRCWRRSRPPSHGGR